MAANNQYKNSVFASLFSDRERLLELYNAIEGTNIDDPSRLTINTLPEVLFMDMRNDISFSIDNKIVVLIEHQSTVNENMPLRMLMYIARVYEHIIDSKAVYKRQMLKIPRPEFIVLYNGKEDYPKETFLSLKEAYESFGDNGAVHLNLTVRVLNINKGRNVELERKSRALDGYASFVAKVREYREQKRPLDEAIKKSVEYCIEKNILKRYLEENSSEVINMLMTEFNLEDALAVRGEECMEKGFEAGRQEGRQEGRNYIINLLEQGLSYEEIKKTLASGNSVV